MTERIAVSILFTATLLLANANPGLAQVPLTAQESILPFPMTPRTVVNPAEAAWNAAPSGPCGTHCLKPRLDVYHRATGGEKAVVYVFHGGEGSAQMWITGEEEAALIGDLVRNNYAVVLLESTHRPNNANWFFPDPDRFDPAGLNLPGSVGVADDAYNATVNADEQLVRNVHALLGYTSTTKVYLAGFSSGAKFASAMAYSLKHDAPVLDDYYYTTPRGNTGGGLNVRAAAIYNNVAVPYYFGNSTSPLAVPKVDAYDTPTIFNYAQNDNGNPVADVEANATFVSGLGVPVEMYMTRSLALRPDRFARVVGLSFVESRDLYAALIADPAFVDVAGYVLPAAQSAPAVTALSAAKQRGVTDQLMVLQAEHHVSAENHHRTVAFFDLHL